MIAHPILPEATPARLALECQLASRERGTIALAVPSGHAATVMTMLAGCRPGDEIVSAVQIYGGSFSIMNFTLRRLGIHTQFVDILNVAEVEASLGDRTRFLFLETVGNPALVIPDLAELIRIAHTRRVLVVVDSTFTTPYLLRPLEFGADIVIHSLTKFIAGHGNSIGGAIVAGPSQEDLLKRIREEVLPHFGGYLAEENARFILAGLVTLDVRMPRHCRNGLALADWLSRDSRVAWVNYPGLPAHPGHQRARELFGGAGFGGMLTFGTAGGLDGGRRFVESVRLASFLANLGDARTLVIHPATTTHSHLSPEELVMAGVSESLIRVSVGLEDIVDIIGDFDQALG